MAKENPTQKAKEPPTQEEAEMALMKKAKADREALEHSCRAVMLDDRAKPLVKYLMGEVTRTSYTPGDDIGVTAYEDGRRATACALLKLAGKI